MKSFILSFVLLVSSGFTQKANISNKCFLPWINLFENYLLFNPGVDNVTFDLTNSSCNSDTLSGIVGLSKNIFYGNSSKRTLDYRPTYLCYSTVPTSIDSLIGDNNASNRPKGALNLPVEMIKIYFIHSLYMRNFEFKERVLLGYRDKDVAVTSNNSKVNRLIMKEAQSSLDKWIRLVEEKGLNYVRTNNIDPLYYSQLEWK